MSTELIPTSDDLGNMMQLAGIMVKSGLCPPALKTPEAVLYAIQAGKELGFPPTVALRVVNIIQGKPEVSAEAMAGKMSQSGVSWVVDEQSVDRAAATFSRNGIEIGVIEFTREDAKRAGLLARDNWRKYPQDMLWARMMSRARRRIAPDVCTGSYVDGELQDAGLSNNAHQFTSHHKPDPVAAEVISVKSEPVSDHTPTTNPEPGDSGMATQAQCRKLGILFKEAQIEDAERKEFLKMAYSVTSMKALPKSTASTLIQRLEQPNAGTALLKYLEAKRDLISSDAHDESATVQELDADLLKAEYDA